MGDIGEIFNSYRVESKDRKANNRQQSLQILLDRGFTVRVYNGDAHLQLEFAVWLVDFWPGTGKWIFWRKPKVYGNRPHFEGRGVFPLLKALERNKCHASAPNATRAPPSKSELLSKQLNDELKEASDILSRPPPANFHAIHTGVLSAGSSEPSSS